MKDLKSLKIQLDSLCFYTAEQCHTLRALSDLLGAQDERSLACAWSGFFKSLCEEGYADNLTGFVSRYILLHDNMFTAAASRGETLPANVEKAVARDLSILQQAAQLTAADFNAFGPAAAALPEWETGTACAPLSGAWSGCIAALRTYHQTNGCGLFARHRAFAWRDKQLVPISYINPITLGELKSYESQRSLVLENTLSFLDGLPSNNVLLYGDRGTGKSSTVHALLNAYAPQGLRMVEMPKSAIAEFPLLISRLSAVPMKFIIFIDDLSFSSGDDSFAELKAALEGGLEARQPNTLIYATSNLRHLVRERFSDRDGDELHAGDTIQEQMSLSDRFGLSVTFINPDRKRFYDILDGIAADRGLEVDGELLHKRAEQWALARGGRSPRIAKQFINIVEAKIRRGLDW